MKPAWRISVTTSPEAEEAVADLLEALFQQTAVVYRDAAKPSAMVAVYLANQPDWSVKIRARLRAGFERIRTCGLDCGPGNVSLRKLRARDWAHAWKRHFKPLRIGRKLLIKPSWNRVRGLVGQAVVILDPGLSFGTGHHPTTRFCLAQIVAARQARVNQSLLDIGTGSGILALAGAKLGYAPVLGLDVDPEAIKSARLNARRNRLSRRITFRRADLQDYLPWRKAEYSVVCANLSADLLVAEHERIVSFLARDGVLVLAGILKSEFPKVQRAYTRAGLILATSRLERDWHCSCFQFKESGAVA